MNKCFITKLPSSIDNDNLPVLGQLKINWLKQDNLTNNDSRAIGLSTNDSITVKVSGAHFTDRTLTSNLGNTKTITSANKEVWLYVSNDANAILTIDNKYSLTELNFSYNDNWSISRSASFDIEDIRYCTNLTILKLPRIQVSGDISIVSNFTNLTQLDLYNTQVSGDISAISQLTNLTYLSLSNTQVSGDINAVSKLTNLTHLSLSNTQVSGDINVLSNLTNLTYLDLYNTQISGDINVLSNLTNLTYLDLYNTQISGDINVLSRFTRLRNTLSLSGTQVSGDINALSNLTNLSNIKLSDTNVSGNINSLSKLTKLTYLSELKNISLTGDMSKIPAKVSFISQLARKVSTNFTWTANGRQNATLLAIEGNVPFDTVSMDNMLIDQATCTVASSAHTGFERNISVFGNRTSASDAAVEAIQNKGITITGVTKQA